MTRDEAIYHLTWVKDLSEMIGMVPIGAEARKAIDAAISALRELDKRKALRQPQPDAETRLMLGIESPSQQLANFKKDERTVADALIAGAKASN